MDTLRLGLNGLLVEGLKALVLLPHLSEVRLGVSSADAFASVID